MWGWLESSWVEIINKRWWGSIRNGWGRTSKVNLLRSCLPGHTANLQTSCTSYNTAKYLARPRIQNCWRQYIRIINKKYVLASELTSQSIKLWLYTLAALFLIRHYKSSENIAVSRESVTVWSIKGFSNWQCRNNAWVRYRNNYNQQLAV